MPGRTVPLIAGKRDIASSSYWQESVERGRRSALGHAHGPGYICFGAEWTAIPGNGRNYDRSKRFAQTGPR